MRKNYAGIGYTYDSVRDAFYAPQPYPSWLLDEETCIWAAPVDMPEPVEGKYYTWDEETVSWIEHTIGEEITVTEETTTTNDTTVV